MLHKDVADNKARYYSARSQKCVYIRGRQCELQQGVRCNTVNPPLAVHSNLALGTAAALQAGGERLPEPHQHCGDKQRYKSKRLRGKTPGTMRGEAPGTTRHLARVGEAKLASAVMNPHSYAFQRAEMNSTRGRGCSSLSSWWNAVWQRVVATHCGGAL